MEKKKILIIGDEPILQHVITDELEKLGFVISHTESCDDAKKLVAENAWSCDLIILDRIPCNVQETESYHNLRAALRENTPVVLLSGEREKDARAAAQKIQADGYLWKGSVTPSTLLKTILDVLESTAKMNRRKYPRHQVSLKVRFHGIRDFLYEYSENISRGGIFIESVHSLPFRTPVDISIELPQSARHVKVTGEVVYSLSPGMAEKLQRKPGFGIQFIKFHDGTERELDEYFQDLLEIENKSIPLGQVYIFYPEGEIHEQIQP